MQATLLVELLTEELPPKALSRLGEVFADAVFKALVERKLVAADARMDRYASPRRLALTVQGVTDRAPDAVVDEKLMPVVVALDADGKPTSPRVLCPDCTPALAALTDAPPPLGAAPGTLTPLRFAARVILAPRAAPATPFHSRAPPVPV